MSLVPTERMLPHRQELLSQGLISAHGVVAVALISSAAIAINWSQGDENSSPWFWPALALAGILLVNRYSRRMISGLTNEIPPRTWRAVLSIAVVTLGLTWFSPFIPPLTSGCAVAILLINRRDWVSQSLCWIGIVVGLASVWIPWDLGSDPQIPPAWLWLYFILALLTTYWHLREQKVRSSDFR